MRLLLSIFLIAVAGCSQTPPAPGVTYSAAALTKEADGKVKQQGEPIIVAGAVVSDVAEIPGDGSSVFVEVRKTSYGRATLTITFPDKTTQTVRLKTGESKDLLSKGHKLGVRIQVQDAH
ncbi:MAG TPA: hypothetical protein VGY66_31850 [Gemmataceae bacterium]|jgi:hypothetical protein|nr:hypothetical protein [Gemmataceae bacterium]